MLGFFSLATDIMSIPSSAIAVPLLASTPFLRINKHGDVLLTIDVIAHAAKTQLDCLYGKEWQLALKVRLNAPG